MADGAAMQFIAAGAKHGVESAATGTADFSVECGGLELQLLNCFRRRHDHGAVVRIRDRDAVHQIVIGPHRAAGDGHLRVAVLILHAGELGIGGEDYTLAELGFEVRIAAEDRQVSDLLCVDELAGGRVGGFERGCVAGNVDGLSHLAEFQGEVERDQCLRRNRNAFVFEFLEAGRFHVDGIRRGCNSAEYVFAGFVAHGGSAQIGGLVG